MSDYINLALIISLIYVGIVIYAVNRIATKNYLFISSKSNISYIVWFLRGYCARYLIQQMKFTRTDKQSIDHIKQNCLNTYGVGRFACWMDGFDYLNTKMERI